MRSRILPLPPGVVDRKRSATPFFSPQRWEAAIAGFTIQTQGFGSLVREYLGVFA